MDEDSDSVRKPGALYLSRGGNIKGHNEPGGDNGGRLRPVDDGGSGGQPSVLDALLACWLPLGGPGPHRGKFPISIPLFLHCKKVKMTEVLGSSSVVARDSLVAVQGSGESRGSNA